MSRATDVRITALEHSYQDFSFRTPIKFGGIALDRATILDVWCDVETSAGKRARGFGSMASALKQTPQLQLGIRVNPGLSYSQHGRGQRSRLGLPLSDLRAALELFK